jgi:hypothetical protein
MAVNLDMHNMFKEFIFCEMIHDFKTDRKKRPQGHIIGADVINFKRYNSYDVTFNEIMDSGITVKSSSSSYNDILQCSSDNVEDTLLQYIANTKPLTLQDFIKNKVNGNGRVSTTIKTNVTDYNYNIDGIEKDKIKSGSDLHHIVCVGTSTIKPIFLVDTGGIIKDLKKGMATPKKEAYIFSPLVTMCDSAGGLDPIDGINVAINKIRFANAAGQIGNTLFTGIKLNNVYSTSEYTISGGNATNLNNIFFSNFDITITYDPTNKKVKQEWRGTQPIGSGPPPLPIGNKYQQNHITYEWYESSNKHSTLCKKSFPANETSHTFEPADILNSQPNCFHFIRQYINGPEKIPPEPAIPNNQRWKENESKLLSTVTYNNFRALALALQRKRAGDWLPVSYILDYDSHKKVTNKIILTQQNWDTNNKKVITTTLSSMSFQSKDMYIVTEDRPLVAYCLFRGVNVIYYMNGFGPVVFKRQ